MTGDPQLSGAGSRITHGWSRRSRASAPRFSWRDRTTGKAAGNGHDTGVAYADRWLENTFGPMLDDPRFTEGTLFIVTFDEDGSLTSNNRVATVLWGTGLRRGVVSRTRYDHYALLRTIEEIFGTGTLGLHDETAAVIGEVVVGP